MEKARILIAEDDGITIMHIEATLKNLGYEICATVASGEKAIEKAEELKPDLALVDVRMQGEIDGIEAAREIRACSGIPVIFLTALSDRTTIERTRDVDPFGYIIKPFDENQLYATVEMALHKRRLEIERQQAENAIRNSEEKYRALVEATDTGYLILDREGKVLDANLEYVRLTGHRKLQDILGKPVTDWTAEHDKQKNTRAVARCTRDGFVRNLGIDYVDRNGQITPIEINATVIGSGNSLHIISLCRDISERKKAGEALQASYSQLEARVRERTAELEKARQDLEARVKERTVELEIANQSLQQEIIERKRGEKQLQAEQFFSNTIVQSMPGLFYILEETSGRFIKRNYNWVEVTGYSDDELDRMMALDVVVDRDLCARRIQEVYDRGSSSMENLLLTRTGEQIPYYFTGHRLVIDGKTYLVGLGLDISERQQAKEAQNEMEEKYRKIVDNTPDLLYRTDMEGRITFVSPSVYRLAGYTEEEAMGLKMAEEIYLIPKERELFLAELKNHGQVENFEAQLKRKDGSLWWVSTNAHFLKDHNGNIVGVEGITRDITERKLSEEKIKASLGEKEVLLKEIHHRVKNNLQTISSLLSLQADYIEDPALQAHFKESRDRVKSMALIHEKIYQTGDLANIEFGTYLRSIVEYLFNSYGRRGLSFSVEADEISLTIDTAIPCALIVNELVSNAFKHAFPDEREGTLQIMLRTDEAHKITLTVCDDGIGFPQRVDFRTTTSLGLTLVNSLMKQLKGAIELKGDNGTAFIITFTPPGE